MAEGGAPERGSHSLDRTSVDLRYTKRSLFGRRYIIPLPVATALTQVFAEPIDVVMVIEDSLYARAHFGMCATTRPNRILLAISGSEFAESPDLLLHEFFHVLRQWRTGRLTRRRYLLESARCGYWDNPYEQEARDFTATAGEQYRRFLQDANASIGAKPLEISPLSFGTFQGPPGNACGKER